MAFSKWMLAAIGFCTLAPIALVLIATRNPRFMPQAMRRKAQAKAVPIQYEGDLSHLPSDQGANPDSVGMITPEQRGRRVSAEDAKAKAEQAAQDKADAEAEAKLSEEVQAKAAMPGGVDTEAIAKALGAAQGSGAGNDSPFKKKPYGVKGLDKNSPASVAMPAQAPGAGEAAKVSAGGTLAAMRPGAQPKTTTARTATISRAHTAPGKRLAYRQAKGLAAASGRLRGGGSLEGRSRLAGQTFDNTAPSGTRLSGDGIETGSVATEEGPKDKAPTPTGGGGGKGKPMPSGDTWNPEMCGEGEHADPSGKAGCVPDVQGTMIFDPTKPLRYALWALVGLVAFALLHQSLIARGGRGDEAKTVLQIAIWPLISGIWSCATMLAAMGSRSEGFAYMGVAAVASGLSWIGQRNQLGTNLYSAHDAFMEKNKEEIKRGQEITERSIRESGQMGTGRHSDGSVH